MVELLAQGFGTECNPHGGAWEHITRNLVGFMIYKCSFRDQQPQHHSTSHNNYCKAANDFFLRKSRGNGISCLPQFPVSSYHFYSDITSMTDATGSAVKSEGEDYIRTATGNFVSRAATLEGAQHVELKGRSWIQAGVTFRGDLAPIRVGRYNSIHKGTTIMPPLLTPSTETNGNYAPVSIGAHTTIGTDCDIQAAAIGSYNSIGNGVVLGPRVILKDAVVVTDGTVVPADMVIPPFTRVSSTSSSTSHHPPQLELIPLSPATSPILQELALDTYHERIRLMAGANA